jgi:hypothetical protein
MTPKSVLAETCPGGIVKKASISVALWMPTERSFDAENFDYQACCRITGTATDRVSGVLKESVEAHARPGVGKAVCKG